MWVDLIIQVLNFCSELIIQASFMNEAVFKTLPAISKGGLNIMNWSHHVDAFHIDWIKRFIPAARGVRLETNMGWNNKTSLASSNSWHLHTHR